MGADTQSAGLRTSRYNMFVPLDEPGRWAIYNTLSGTIVEADEEAVSCLRGARIEGLTDPGVRADLLAQGVLIEKAEDELAWLKSRHLRAKADNPTTSLMLIPTYECNLRCPYCYEGKKSRGRLEASMAQLICVFAEQAITQERSEHVSFLLFGGEPGIGGDTEC